MEDSTRKIAHRRDITNKLLTKITRSPPTTSHPVRAVAIPSNNLAVEMHLLRSLKSTRNVCLPIMSIPLWVLPTAQHRLDQHLVRTVVVNRFRSSPPPLLPRHLLILLVCILTDLRLFLHRQRVLHNDCRRTRRSRHPYRHLRHQLLRALEVRHRLVLLPVRLPLLAVRHRVRRGTAGTTDILSQPSITHFNRRVKDRALEAVEQIVCQTDLYLTPVLRLRLLGWAKVPDQKSRSRHRKNKVGLTYSPAAETSKGMVVDHLINVATMCSRIDLRPADEEVISWMRLQTADEDRTGTLAAVGPIPRTLKAQSAEAIEDMVVTERGRTTAVTEMGRAETTIAAGRGMGMRMKDRIVVAVVDHQIDRQEKQLLGLTISGNLHLQLL